MTIVKKYPREDVCAKCGKHLGWVMSSMGEFLALGLCEDCRAEKDAPK